MEIISYCMLVVLQAMVLLFYLKNLFELKYSVWWIFVCWWIMEVLYEGYLMVIEVLHIDSPIVIVMNAVIHICCLGMVTFLICKGSWKRKVLLTILYNVFVMACEVVIINVAVMLGVASIEQMVEDDVISNVMMVLTQIFTFVLMQIAFAFFKRGKKEQFVVQKWKGVLLTSVACSVVIIYMAFNMIQYNDFSKNQIIALIVLICFDFFCYYLYDVQVKETEMIMRNRIYQEQINLYQQQYDGIRKMKQEVNAVNHDIRNHLSVLKGLCDRSSRSSEPEVCISEIEKYLDMVNVQCQFEGYDTDSGNILIDAVIDMKKGYANSCGIKTEVELFLPGNMSYNGMDIVIILSNLFDNAIEACKKLDGDRRISLEIRYVMKSLFVKMANTYDGSLDGKQGDVQYGSIQTTKNDKKNHGIGMKNIGEVVKKYNGVMQWEADNKEFVVNIMIYEFDNP